MRSIVLTSAAVFAGVLLAGTATMQVKAGGDLVKFPEDYAKGVLYTTVDRADNKQYRELYTSRAAIDAVKAGKPVPSGTVITLVQYKAKLAPDGTPMKGPDGRFVKDELIGYTVMEKRTGWGKEYPDTIRNGEWEYQAFTATKAVNTKANLEACFKCHKPYDKDDYLFTIKQMREAK